MYLCTVIKIKGINETYVTDKIIVPLLKCFSFINQREIVEHTVFNLITAHTPISTQSRNSIVFRLQPVYFFLYFFTKAYVVGTHLNCIDKSTQFK